MFIVQPETGEAMDREGLGDEPRTSGTFKVPSRETGDRPTLQKDLECFAILSRWFEPLREDDLTGGNRV